MIILLLLLSHCCWHWRIGLKLILKLEKSKIFCMNQSTHSLKFYELVVHNSLYILIGNHSNMSFKKSRGRKAKYSRRLIRTAVSVEWRQTNQFQTTFFSSFIIVSAADLQVLYFSPQCLNILVVDYFIQTLLTNRAKQFQNVKKWTKQICLN